MNAYPPSFDDDALRRYLDGDLPEATVERLLAQLLVSDALRGRLDALRRAESAPIDEACAFAAGQDGLPATALFAEQPELLKLTPPGYVFNGSRGGRKAMMGAEDSSQIFGPESQFEVEFCLEDDEAEHGEVELFIADADGRLRRTALGAQYEGEAVFFAGQAAQIFPHAGDWTLCAIVDARDADALATLPLAILEKTLASGRLLTHRVTYREAD